MSHKTALPVCRTIAPNIESWELDGDWHKEDSPAFINTRTGFKSWWLYGKRHRVDGPAVIRDNGTEEWWVDGRKYDLEDIKTDFELQNKYPKLKTLMSIMFIHNS